MSDIVLSLVCEFLHCNDTNGTNLFLRALVHLQTFLHRNGIKASLTQTSVDKQIVQNLGQARTCLFFFRCGHNMFVSVCKWKEIFKGEKKKNYLCVGFLFHAPATVLYAACIYTFEKRDGQC